MHEDSDSLGDGLIYAARFPLRWQPLAAESPTDAARRDNADLLRVLALVEEPLGEGGEERGSAELQTINAKLDVLIGLLGRVLGAQQVMPAEADVRLHATGIEWSDAQPPAAGERILLELYLSPSHPGPLRLAARVTACAARDARTSRVKARFEDQDEPTRAWLEKHIFRHHRRLIAQRRRGDA